MGASLWWVPECVLAVISLRQSLFTTGAVTKTSCRVVMMSSLFSSPCQHFSYCLLLNERLVLGLVDVTKLLEAIDSAYVFSDSRFIHNIAIQ